MMIMRVGVGMHFWNYLKTKLSWFYDGLKVGQRERVKLDGIFLSFGPAYLWNVSTRAIDLRLLLKQYTQYRTSWRNTSL